MKALTITGAVIIVLIAAFFVFSSPATDTNSSESTQDQSSQIEKLTIDTVKADIEQGAHLLDVRTQEEFDESHIEDGELFPLVAMQGGTFPTFSKDTKLFLYCRTGNRSAQAKALLDGAGFTDVVDLGGLEDMLDIGAKLVVRQ